MGDAEVISSYTCQQAVEDGRLVEIFKNRWPEQTHGKPILATIVEYSEASLAALQEIWNEFVVWQHAVIPTLQEEERVFVTEMNRKKVWVIDDSVCYTLLYPEDY